MIGPMLGEESPLNQPNCLYGIIFFLIYLTLGTVNQVFTWFFHIFSQLYSQNRHIKILWLVAKVDKSQIYNAILSKTNLSTNYTHQLTRIFRFSLPILLCKTTQVHSERLLNNNVTLPGIHPSICSGWSMSYLSGHICCEHWSCSACIWKLLCSTGAAAEKLRKERLSFLVCFDCFLYSNR